MRSCRCIVDGAPPASECAAQSSSVAERLQPSSSMASSDEGQMAYPDPLANNNSRQQQNWARQQQQQSDQHPHRRKQQQQQRHGHSPGSEGADGCRQWVSKPAWLENGYIYPRRYAAMPTDYGWKKKKADLNNKLEIYQKVFRNAGRLNGIWQLNYWPTTGTTCTWMVGNKKQMFRRRLTDEQFRALLDDTRIHTGKGYQTKRNKAYKQFNRPEHW